MLVFLFSWNGSQHLKRIVLLEPFLIYFSIVGALSGWKRPQPSGTIMKVCTWPARVSRYLHQSNIHMDGRTRSWAAEHCPKHQLASFLLCILMSCLPLSDTRDSYPGTSVMYTKSWFRPGVFFPLPVTWTKPTITQAIVFLNTRRKAEWTSRDFNISVLHGEK